MDALFELTRKITTPFLRISMAVVLLWIGGLKFADPSPVVGLLGSSLFSPLASPGFVYLLGTIEVVAGVLLLAGYGVRYVGLVLVGLFVGTLVIFLTSPKVSYGDHGFPYLTLAGEFLLKDLVLIAAAVALAGLEPMRTKGSMV